MNMDLTIKFLGVRGSFPTPSSAFLEYGGNTSCVQVTAGRDVIFFDAGSGLAQADVVPCSHLFLSHFHLDHLLGLFGSPLLTTPGTEVHFYGPSCDGADLHSRLEALLSPPYWPVRLDELPARTEFHPVAPEMTISLPHGVTVRTMQGNHPNGCVLYRLDAAGKSLVYGLDCEADAAAFQKLTEFATGADMVIWDASFFPEDFIPGWGHSTWEQGLLLQKAAGVKKICMTHFSPRYRDAQLKEQEQLAGKTSGSCFFAKEGMEVRL